MTQRDPALERAEKQVKDVRDFYYHFMTYVFVNTLMVIIDRRGGETGQSFIGLDWAYWVIIAWGLGVAGHAITVNYGDRRVQQVYRQEKNG